eukprot:gene4535-biopygen2555
MNRPQSSLPGICLGDSPSTSSALWMASDGHTPSSRLLMSFRTISDGAESYSSRNSFPLPFSEEPCHPVMSHEHREVQAASLVQALANVAYHRITNIWQRGAWQRFARWEVLLEDRIQLDIGCLPADEVPSEHFNRFLMRCGGGNSGQNLRRGCLLHSLWEIRGSFSGGSVASDDDLF